MVMECCYRLNFINENGVPPKRYRQRMYRGLLKQGPFNDEMG